MKPHLRTQSSVLITCFAAISGCLLTVPAWGQKYPITTEQSATARQVAQAGVPLSALAPNAPDSYMVKKGDTLWDISKLFLLSPWRWPELWGMNMEDIKNPHLIYPGQLLVLVKRDGRATLTMGTVVETQLEGAGGVSPVETSSTTPSPDTVRLSPRIRSEAQGPALSTISLSAIEAYLTDPLIVEENELANAPRIVAAQENRVMLSRGDRAYARGSVLFPLIDDGRTTQRFRIFRNAKPLVDPLTRELLGYEAQFVGKAQLFRGESEQNVEDDGGDKRRMYVPATIDIDSAKEEIRVGDHMLPVPARAFLNFTPHAPVGAFDARIVSVYGSAVVNAAQNQVVVINRGRRDGVEIGHVLAILKSGQQLVDKTDTRRTLIKLPDERNGLLLVFKLFDKVSYGLILDTTDGVRVGDRLVTPQN